MFGNSTAGGAYVPGMRDYVVMIKERSKVFLGGPPLVKMATGEETDDETLGGAEMHARVSGLADYLAVDEHDAIRLGRQIVRRLNWRKRRPPSRERQAAAAVRPRGAAGLACDRPRVPFDPREVLARVVDGSDFDEFKPLYGTVAGDRLGDLHGYPIGVLANARGVLFSEEAQKAAQFIQLANQVDTPLLFLQNTTGYMVGKEYEQGGHHQARRDDDQRGLQQSRCRTSTLHHGRLLRRRQLRHVRPGVRPALPVRLAEREVRRHGPRPAGRSAVHRGPARRPRRRAGPYDEDADAAMRALVEEQIEEQSLPLFLSGRLYDDGVIDPRDTRTVLGICLSAHRQRPSRGRGFGVFRM